MRIIFTRIGCNLLTCGMYMSDLRHIHDPVLSSLKMDGIRLFFFNSLPQRPYDISVPVTRSSENIPKCLDSGKASLNLLYVFFWVIPRRLNLICRLFGKHCLFHLHMQVGE
jgi:hypothetical protein